MNYANLTGIVYHEIQDYAFQLIRRIYAQEEYNYVLSNGFDTAAALEAFKTADKVCRYMKERLHRKVYLTGQESGWSDGRIMEAFEHVAAQAYADAAKYVREEWQKNESAGVEPRSITGLLTG